MSVPTYIITLHQIEVAGLSNATILTDEEAALAHLMIKEIDQKITRLTAELDAERSRLHALKIAVAPHKRVPSEVLRTIFTHSLSEKLNSCIPDAHSSPWVLRQVCSLWRTIVIHEPTFWNTITFDSRHPKARLGNLSFWRQNIINLSYPISLDITESRLNRIPYDDIIMPHRRRIQRLAMLATRTLLEINPKSFPILEDLRLIFCDHVLDAPKNYQDLETSRCFIGMDNLRSLNVTFDIFCVVHLPMTIPWNQLTHLKLTSSHLHRLVLNLTVTVQILRRCPNVKKCHIQFSVDEDEIDVIPEPVCLHCLESLVLFQDIQDMSLLDFLFTPALVSLHLELGNAEDDLHLPSVQSLIIRSGCNLGSFRTSQITHTPSYTSCPEIDLDNMSSLHELEVDILFSDETLEKIAIGTLLPNVQCLSFFGSGENAVQKMVQLAERRSPSRLRISITLHEVQVTGPLLNRVKENLEQVAAYGTSMTVIDSSGRRM